MWHKIFLGVGVLLFSIFAYLQINDATQYGNHDAWIWLLIYGYMALISALQLSKKVVISRDWLSVFVGFVWGAFLFRIQDAQGNLHWEWLHPSSYWDPTGTTMVQNSNESGGLLILAVWATVSLLCFGAGRETKMNQSQD